MNHENMIDDIITDVSVSDRKQSSDEQEKFCWFTDNFVFCRVLQKNPKLAKKLIEMILGFQIDKLTLIQGENGIDISKDIRSVRFDVMAKNNKELYDVEMQTYVDKDLEHRIRYYIAMMSIEDMSKGKLYGRLKNCYVIMICTYDPFKLGRPIYRFRMREDDDGAPDYDDGARCIVVNTTSKALDQISPDVANLIRYLISGDPVDNFTSELENKVKEIMKDPKEIRARMTFEEIEEKARLKGLERGLQEGLERGMQEGHEKGMKEGVIQGRKEERLSGIFHTVSQTVTKGLFSSEEEACDFFGYDFKEYQLSKKQCKIT